MMFRKVVLVAGLLLAAPALGQSAPSAADLERARTQGAALLFWSQEQRDANFPAMEKAFPGKIVKAGTKVRPLPKGQPLPIADADIDAFITAQNVAGLIVLQDGQVRLERYARGLKPEGRWTSFSVAKSFTSTLVGAAIEDGYIKSVADPVTRYIPELAGSGYDGVTVEQLLTMTSGVKWNEDYTDPKSDVAQMMLAPLKPGQDAVVEYMRKLPRDTAPGTKWVYKTGETNLVGVLVQRATGKGLAQYLSEKLWKPFGMERDAFWMVDPSNHEMGGCCLSISLRDYARMGLLTMDPGKVKLPPGWFHAAAGAHAEIGVPGFGYGYQWWTYPEGRYGGQGIFGQQLRVDPRKHMVIVAVGAWPRATDRKMSVERNAFFDKLFAAGE
jgi:CubicO group peptidase (beta-lactamase class C family)